MSHLDFWLHMNADYMWRWYCSDEQGTLVAMSSRAYFNRAEAQRAVDKVRCGMSPTPIAA